MPAEAIRVLFFQPGFLYLLFAHYAAFEEPQPASIFHSQDNIVLIHGFYFSTNTADSDNLITALQCFHQPLMLALPPALRPDNEKIENHEHRYDYYQKDIRHINNSLYLHFHKA